jgi:hypothetical protein
MNQLYNIGDRVKVNSNSDYYGDWLDIELWIIGIDLPEPYYGKLLIESQVRYTTSMTNPVKKITEPTDGWKHNELDLIESVYP